MEAQALKVGEPVTMGYVVVRQREFTEINRARRGASRIGRPLICSSEAGLETSDLPET